MWWSSLILKTLNFEDLILETTTKRFADYSPIQLLHFETAVSS